ncbi:MAG: BadF/BadG/BcrA/BcrD ATPase family protein [Bacteroidota bacterium]
MPKKALQYDGTIIGIDGGGSRTRGILYRNGKVVAQSQTGTTRVGTVGLVESCERLLNIITELCHQAEISFEELDAVVIGLAGVWLEEEQQRSTQVLKLFAREKKLILNDVIVTSDAAIALEGALNGAEGMVLIGGTGTIALGKTADGTIMRCGGWGIELDDMGSGAWVGREGLTAVVRSLDGRGAKTEFADVLAANYPMVDLANPRTIVSAYGERVFEYHNLTPLVMECAEKGDEVCLDIVRRAAFHLNELVEALSARFKTQPLKIALMGGMLESDTLLSKLLREKVDKNSALSIVKPKGSALDGALAIGQKVMTSEAL